MDGFNFLIYYNIKPVNTFINVYIVFIVVAYTINYDLVLVISINSVLH